MSRIDYEEVKFYNRLCMRHEKLEVLNEEFSEVNIDGRIDELEKIMGMFEDNIKGRVDDVELDDVTREKLEELKEAES